MNKILKIGFVKNMENFIKMIYQQIIKNNNFLENHVKRKR